VKILVKNPGVLSSEKPNNVEGGKFEQNVPALQNIEAVEQTCHLKYKKNITT